MKVALYYRVSTMEQAQEGYSIGEQQNKLEKYCEARDWKIVDRYSDPGYSGSNLERPGIQRLIEDCKKHRFEMVVVFKLDRLSRSQKDTLYLIEDVFQAQGIDFTSMSENFDTSTPFGKAVIGLLSVFAQLEREQIRERMTLGKVGRARSGKAMSWHNIPFGYAYDKVTQSYVVNPAQAPIVKSIFQDYLAGKSITKIRDDLNQAGHIEKNVPWSYRTVRQILDNITYTGRTKFKDQIYEGNHEALVSESDYNEVQKELKIRQLKSAQRFNPRPFRAKFMLSGLLRCGECGAVMQIHVGKTRHGNYRYYRCPSTVSHRSSGTYKRAPDCSNHQAYPKDDLEELVIDQIKDLNLQRFKTKQERKEDPYDNTALQTQLDHVQSQLNKLIDLYLNSDGLDLSIIDDRRQVYLAQQKALQEKLNDQKRLKLSNQKVINLLTTINWDKATYDEKKMVVKQLISYITLTPNNLDIHWNF